MSAASENCRVVQGSSEPKGNITSEQCTDNVGCTGSARYRAIECREIGTRVVPQRFYAFVSYETRAFFMF